MRKILIYIFLFVMLCFIIPTIFTKRIEDTNEIEIAKNENNKLKENNSIDKNNYNYEKYNTIKLLHSKTEEIEEIPLDEYLYGVVSAEMPATFEIEALKAQAVVARTYTIYKIENNSSKHEKADICDNSRLLPSMDI